jgi:hypothetical protein
MPRDFSVGELTLSTEVGRAAWIVEQVRDFEEYQVGSLLPDVFEAYARLFHPAHLAREDGTREVRWEDVAQANHKHAHPSMEWGSITDSWQLTHQTGLWDHEPDTESLPLAQGERLAEVLAGHTTTREECWFAVWDGFGFLLPGPDPLRVEMPDRAMILFRGALAGALASFHNAWRHSPSLWWSDDHAWCVATDVDLMTTYIGSGTDCISSILAASDLEAMQIPITRASPGKRTRSTGR